MFEHDDTFLHDAVLCSAAQPTSASRQSISEIQQPVADQEKPK